MRRAGKKPVLQAFEGRDIREALLKVTGGVIVELDRKGKITLFNKGAERITGWKAGQVLGKEWIRTLIPPTQRETVKAVLADVMLGKESAALNENPIITKKGELRYIFWSNALLAKDGKPDAMISFGEDVTALKRAHAALEESERRYREIVENSCEYIQSIGIDGRFRYVNPAWLKTMGYTKRELGKLKIWDVIAPESRKHCERLFRKVMFGKKINNIKATFLTKDGWNIVVEGSAGPKYKDGKVVATHGIFHNVTEREGAISALKDSEELTSLILNSVEYPIIFLDRAGRIIHINKAATEISGYGEPDLVGMPFSSLRIFTPASLAKMESVFAKRMNGRNVKPYEIGIIRKDGRRNTVEVKSSALKRRGSLAGEVIVLRDVTGRKESEMLRIDYEKTLEQEIASKTKELEQKVMELEKKNMLLESFKEFAIGRENELIRLRKELKQRDGKDAGQIEANDAGGEQNESES